MLHYSFCKNYSDWGSTVFRLCLRITQPDYLVCFNGVYVCELQMEVRNLKEIQFHYPFIVLYSVYRYVLTAPKIFRVGASEKVVVQAFDYEKEFAVNIAIRSFPDKLAVYSSGHISLTPANKFQDAVTLTVRNLDLQCFYCYIQL